MLVAYYRVSTQRQGQSGLGLEAQRSAIRQHARYRQLKVVAEYTEVESGRERQRPKLAAAVAEAKALGATLVVAKLDRLARDVSLILSLVDSGVSITFLDLPDIGTDAIVGRLVLTVMAAIAEFEARRIGQRIKDAFAARRARGLKHPRAGVARKKADRDKGTEAARPVNRERWAEFVRKMRPLALGLKAEGRSLTAVAEEMNKRGFKTRRGQPWTYATVWRLLKAKPG